MYVVCAHSGIPEHCLSFDGRGRDDEKGRFTGFGLNDEFCEGQDFYYICQKVAEQQRPQ